MDSLNETEFKIQFKIDKLIIKFTPTKRMSLISFINLNKVCDVP